MAGDKTEKLAYLLDKARGPDRSYREYAKDAGVSSAAISRMRKGDYIPKPDTIEKLTSEAAKPRGGVTYEEMMRTAGYAVDSRSEPDESTISIIANEALVETDQDVLNRSANDAIRQNVIESDRNKRNDSENIRENIRETLIRFDKEVTAQIYTALVNKGIVFKLNDAGLKGINSRRYDLCIELMEQKVVNWLFDYKYCRYADFRMDLTRIQMMMGGALFSRLDSNTKLSYVINNERLYQYMERFEHQLSYRGELSVILFDTEAGILVDEFYLSNYDTDNMEKEIYIA